MSSSPNTLDDADFGRVEGKTELDRMMHGGRAFSGHERNCCFLNTLGFGADGDRFATISAVSGLDLDDDGRALASVDWDQDGQLDLWVTNRNAPRIRFFRNQSETGHGFVQLRLQGNGLDTNRDAIGARVTLVLKPEIATSQPSVP